jgi:putative ABC transport system ATP-binding protein
MGPSGSGKSTLLHCLAGILTPDRGSVTFESRAVERLGEAERSRLRRTAFGFVFQFGQLVPELSAIENVALPLLLNGVGRRDAEAAAAAWFPRLGLGGTEARRPGELSGGQAQRIAVARAMVAGPSVVFADEPTGSLDSLAGEQVMELLTAAAIEEGVSVLLVTHEARVAAYAHREIVVRDGRISGVDRP